MKTILDLETEMGRSDMSGLGVTPGRTAVWSVCIHTTARCSPCGAGLLMRLDQRCFLRAGSEVCPQPWVHSVTRVEITSAGEDGLMSEALAAHEHFADMVNDTWHGFADWVHPGPRTEAGVPQAV